MTPLKPADIFVIQAAIEQYQRKHPDSETPSAEVALAWYMSKLSKHKKAIVTEAASEGGLLTRIFENVRFLFKPLSSAPR
jgi:hypothetical protein